MYASANREIAETKETESLIKNWKDLSDRPVRKASSLPQKEYFGLNFVSKSVLNILLEQCVQVADELDH